MKKHTDPFEHYEYTNTDWHPILTTLAVLVAVAFPVWIIIRAIMTI